MDRFFRRRFHIYFQERDGSESRTATADAHHWFGAGQRGEQLDGDHNCSQLLTRRTEGCHYATCKGTESIRSGMPVVGGWFAVERW